MRLNLGRKRKNTLWAKLKRQVLAKRQLIRLLFLVLVIIFSWAFLSLISAKLKSLGVDEVAKAGYSFVFPSEGIKTKEGRTNLLLLGKGGENHEAGDLTDTIIFLSVPKKGTVIEISLPRDIWVKSLRTKLNSVYYWGNQKKEKGGMVLVKSSVEEIVGEPIHYVLIIDFSGFRNIIDALDGVVVDVERPFADEKYPLPGREDDDCGGDPDLLCRYETIEFAAGAQWMGGERALKYVRSRNSEGEEGTDIARAKRQQRLIEAIKSKILSFEVLGSPQKLTRIYQVLVDSIETDLVLSQASALLRNLLTTRGLNSFILSEELLVNPPRSLLYDNLYVFTPKEGSWEAVHQWVKSLYQN